ncbi:sensor histidine kinase [Herbiconiux daphne]|uniref:Sensor histidine kinase n=1 Tax=Herbiconiux daphne TaxID=2970914 RepID=A0ABT2H393_9MICO|nr:sensor histidine kinase [Herbiconiux daphne]MCS5734410.1 sensor histidine kinase [Herbiconiux daphne]
MTGNRWWHVAVAVTLVVVAVLVVLNPAEPAWTTPAAIGVLAAFGAFYFTVGRRGLCESPWATPLQVAVIATAVVGCALSPNVATIQCIAFPLIWTLSAGPGMRRAIVASTIMAVGVALALAVSFGWGIEALAQASVIEFVSLALGIGIGVWFTTELRKGGENTRLLAELTAAQGQLAALHREAGATAERERLARELHDTIAQNLTSLVMLAQRGQNRVGDDAGVRDDLELIEQVARDALNEARALVAATAPVGVEGGLAAALRRLVATFERETRIDITTELDDVGGLPRDHEVVLLRCAQEALANVRKHAGARHVRLTLARVARFSGGEADAADARTGDEGAPGTAGGIRLTVSDDGVGIAAPIPTDSGFGLDGMHARLALVGGSLRVARGAGGGTDLVATVPSPRDDQPDAPLDGQAVGGVSAARPAPAPRSATVGPAGGGGSGRGSRA